MPRRPHAASAADVPEEAEVPTLADAFDTLALAVLAHTEEDMPVWTHIQDIRGWHANGNIAISWQHLILALEGVLGTSLRG